MHNIIVTFILAAVLTILNMNIYKMMRVLGRMRYWITLVLIFFAVEAHGQDFTREVGDLIASHTDCEYLIEHGDIHFYQCEETLTTSQFMVSIHVISLDYETLEQVAGWDDIENGLIMSAIKHTHKEKDQLYIILYGHEKNIFGVTLPVGDEYIIVE